MTGRRVPDGAHPVLAPGEYGRDETGAWEACTPNGRRGALTAHSVVEHDDGTITVSPSIQVDPVPSSRETGALPGWHGYLRAGVWSEA